MTPIHSVARADKEHSGAAGLRITESSAAILPSSLVQPRTTPQMEMMRTAYASIRAGWSWLERKRSQQLSSRRLRLAETISLGEKRSVSIVQVDGAHFLIGCSTGSVQLLAVLNQLSDETKPLSDIERAS